MTRACASRICSAPCARPVCRFPRSSRAFYFGRSFVCLLAGCSGAFNRRDIGRSAWPQTAERLLSQGVRILDGAGVAWRPRLKTAQAPRKRKTKGAQAHEEGQMEQSGASTSMQAPVQKAKRPRKRRAPRYYDDNYDDWTLPDMASGLVSQMLDEMADFY